MRHAYQVIIATTWHYILAKPNPRLLKYQLLTAHTHAATVKDQSVFLSEEDRKALTALARDGSSRCRVSRRANSFVLCDKGWSCQQVDDALLLDDDTIRGGGKLVEQRGIEGITSFDVGGSASDLSVKQEDDLK